MLLRNEVCCGIRYRLSYASSHRGPLHYVYTQRTTLPPGGLGVSMAFAANITGDM